MDLLGLVDVSMWMLLTALCLVLFYIYGSFPMGTWKRHGIRGPPPVPFLGNAHQFFNPKTGLRDTVQKWVKEYGKIIGIQYFRKPVLLVTDTEAITEICVKKFNIFHDRFFIAEGKFFTDIVNSTMFHVKGSDWRRLRRIISQTFTGGKLKLLGAEMNRTAKQLAEIMLNYAKSGIQPAAKDVYSAFTLDVIARTSFSLDSKCQTDRENDKFFKMATSLLAFNFGAKAAMVTAGVFPYSALVLRKMKFAMLAPESLDYLEKIVGNLVTQRKKTPESFSHVDFLQLLLQAEMDPAEKMSGDKKLSEYEIVSQGMLFIMAGYETTSSTLQYMSHALALRQEIQERVVGEMKTVVGDACEITYEHCEKLKYTEAVINETIRANAPVQLIFREALQDTTVKGFHVPAKTGVLIPLYNVGHDPDVYPNPEIFDPERFMNSENKNIFGFGVGPKTCIGLRLAMMEIKIAFYHLLKSVRLTGVSPEVLEFDDHTIVPAPKKPIYLSVKPRTNF